MSGMEFNKIFAAILVAGIIGMTTGIIAEMLVSPEELEEPAFRVDTGAEPAEIAPAEEEALPPIAPLLAAADPADRKANPTTSKRTRRDRPVTLRIEYLGSRRRVLWCDGPTSR